MQKKISVIVPVYNVSKYLNKCLESLVGQTYNNLEIICVDDGSTDNSGRICDEFAARDDRVVVIHKTNGGSSAARNTGLEIATGDYITFVDGDDWIEKEMYENMMKTDSSDCDIIVCGYKFAYEDRNESAANECEVPTCVMDMKEFLPYIYIRDKYRGVASYIWNKLFKARVINKEEHRIRFDTALGSCGDDIWFAAECYMNAEKIIYVPFEGYNYVQRENSSFQSAIGKRLEHLNHILAYEKIIRLYEENNIDQSVMQYIYRFYVYHCGLLLEYAKQVDDKQKMELLSAKIDKYLDVYKKTNEKNPERILWIEKLMGTDE